jgi:hypothetical protein
MIKMRVKSGSWDLANFSDTKVNQTIKALKIFHAVFSHQKFQ